MPAAGARFYRPVKKEELRNDGSESRDAVVTKVQFLVRSPLAVGSSLQPPVMAQPEPEPAASSPVLAPTPHPPPGLAPPPGLEPPEADTEPSMGKAPCMGKAPSAFLFCENGHGLCHNVIDKDGFECDACGCDQSVGSAMWGCRTCNYDLCIKCATEDFYSATKPKVAKCRQPADNKQTVDPTCQVVLHGLPAPLMKEPMMRAMMEQANLEEALVSCSMHPGRQVAILTMSNAAWAHKCVQHFHGRNWGTSVISANLQVSNPGLSAAAPAFFPSNFSSLTLSASTPAFIPVATKSCGMRSRVYSNTSTEAGPDSEDASVEDSDSESDELPVLGLAA
eukprot:gnl/TRDRNA2_/TRDRNA2_193212_c0_seq1.p1 gnl/TRDRNA2_/TRDRNA2_193212_c0~~gnl/TRDRNA2_/TRDRNA2_193212_c0_seq1.p1  ORF type:complete len:362 (+),score=39.63 gnl/TRDRNA2_/TRDRNA2_193212_c0_seq1:81-1088(+)